MFAQIASVIQIVISGIKPTLELKDRTAKEAALTDMLRFYFLLKDTVDDGEALIVDAGSNPAAKLKAMSVEGAGEAMKRWDITLRKQGGRLQMLEGMLVGQQHLAVLNPALQDELTKAIGYKGDRIVTLQGIGAALFFNAMMGGPRSIEDKSNLVLAMAGEAGTGNTLDLARIRWEVAEMRRVLEQYRALTEQLMSKDEVLRLSKIARADTLLHAPDV